MAYDNF